MDESVGLQGRAGVESRDPALAPTWRAALRAEWHRPTTRREVLRLAAWVYVVVALAIPTVRAAAGFNQVAFPLVLVSALLVLLWVAPRQSEFRTWVVYAVGIYFFTQLRDAADETTIQASTGYVLNWEEWMFGGTTPTAWLQDRLGGASGDPGGLAFFATFMHWSWFFFPHALVAGTYFLARPMFFRVAMIMMGIFFAAVLLYYLVPTVPPWLAVEEGNATGAARIMESVGPKIFGQSLWDDLFGALAEPNARAAMPSLHFGAAMQMTLIGWLLGSRKLTALGVAYSAALAFSLMYLGEHYFADILVGGLLAGASFFFVDRACGGPGLPWRELPRPQLPSPPAWPEIAASGGQETPQRPETG